MKSITNLKILIVGLTTVLALTNLGKEEFRKEKVKCYYSSSNILSDQIRK